MQLKKYIIMFDAQSDAFPDKWIDADLKSGIKYVFLRAYDDESAIRKLTEKLVDRYPESLEMGDAAGKYVRDRAKMLFFKEWQETLDMYIDDKLKDNHE